MDHLVQLLLLERFKIIFNLVNGILSDTIRKINSAYKLLRTYCDNYSFSFDHDTFLLQNPEERIREQFYADPIWSDGEDQ